MENIENSYGITAMVLTYNEEDRVKDVLDCLKEFDEVIILDKSSTDATREIATKWGAKVLQVPYYNDSTPLEVKKIIKKYLYEMQNNEWIFGITSSDIIHYQLYSEMKKFLQNNSLNYNVIEVPIYRFSMGIEGKHTYYGEKTYISNLWNRATFNDKETIIHEDPNKDEKRARLHCNNEIAIYHLTHAKLETIMDRHLRYAVQYVTDYEKKGKSRKDIMKYAIKENVKMCCHFFTHGIFTKKWEGISQCMMLVMYNSMIYLNAFFDENEEEKIAKKYSEITKKCRGNENASE